MPPKKIKKQPQKLLFSFLIPPLSALVSLTFFRLPSYSSTTRTPETTHLLATLVPLEPLKPHTS